MKGHYAGLDTDSRQAIAGSFSPVGWGGAIDAIGFRSDACYWPSWYNSVYGVGERMTEVHIIVETDSGGSLRDIPKLPPNSRFELRLRHLEPEEDRDRAARRQPHPDIAGKVITHGDVFSSAPLSDWDFSGPSA